MSYSFGVYYVRTSAPVDELRAQFGRMDVAAPGWLACGFGDSNCPDEAFESEAEDPAVFASKELSGRFGEAMYLYVDSGTDQLFYDHSRDGVLLRKLLWVYDGAASSWLCAAGEPEGWEDALFSEQQRAQCLAVVEPEEQDEVREIFARRRIATGARFPSCDATVADLIEAHFGLTRPRR